MRDPVVHLSSPLQLAVLSILCLLAPSAGAAQNRLGDVHFETSCKAGVQPRFDSAVALLHSFEFGEAEAAFREVESHDPQCVIAAWGVALAVTERSGANAPKKDLAQGWAELQPWLHSKAQTEREQMYVDAVRALYEHYDTTSGTLRWQLYLAKMKALSQRYPQDINARLLYGLGLTWTAGPGRAGLAQRQKAMAIFLPIFEKYPDNPGAAHYIIHAADTPELAAQALPAARKYASIAPGSPHALHMPSHIFNRLGYWADSIRANQASARVAAEWTKTGHDATGDELHALNNLEYAYLQLGEDEQARHILDQIADRAKTGSDRWLAVDGRIYFDLETHDWRDAETIEPPSGSAFEENFDAFWIQTIAAGHLGDSARAKQSLEQYRRSSAAWDKEHGWGDVHGIALTEAEAWTLFSEGQQEKAVAALNAVQPFEHDHPMYFADVLPRPTGEMLGEMLLRMNKPAEALRAYQRSLELAPNRYDSLEGAKEAAALTGNTELVRAYSRQLHDEGAITSARPQDPAEMIRVRR